MTDTKMKDTATAADFGIPAEWLECAENYANFVRYSEREECATVCANMEIEGSYLYGDMCADAIHSRGLTSDK